jgi:glycogen debranching enzyme
VRHHTDWRWAVLQATKIFATLEVLRVSFNASEHSALQGRSGRRRISNRIDVDAMTESELRENLRQLFARNSRQGYSALLGQHYCYISPSPQTYPFQWFWDTCFHVIMLARLGDYETAKRNLRSLFTMQEADGFVGHMIFWKQVLPRRRSDVLQARPTLQTLRPHMSALIQPPLAATALLALFEADGDRVFLGELYARIRRHHEWLARNRDFDGDGLLTIISPFESGMDWKAAYDPVLGYTKRTTKRGLYTSSLYWKGINVDLCNFVRGYHLRSIREAGKFLVKDVGFNSIYAMDLRAMEMLARLIGDDPKPFAQRRHRVVTRMLELMYDEDACAFYDVHEPGARKLRINTPTIFFPLMLEEIDSSIAKRVLDTHFDREHEFRVPLPIPSVALNDPSFYPGQTSFIWRGPTWAFINWFLYRALKKRRFDDHAERLRHSLWQLVEKGGFREYYDPFTGEGHGARDFTWSGLLVDMQ